MCVSLPHRYRVLIVFTKLHVGLKDILLYIYICFRNFYDMLLNSIIIYDTIVIFRCIILYLITLRTSLTILGMYLSKTLCIYLRKMGVDLETSCVYSVVYYVCI